MRHTSGHPGMARLCCCDTLWCTLNWLAKPRMCQNLSHHTLSGDLGRGWPMGARSPGCGGCRRRARARRCAANAAGASGLRVGRRVYAGCGHQHLHHRPSHGHEHVRLLASCNTMWHWGSSCCACKGGPIEPALCSHWNLAMSFPVHSCSAHHSGPRLTEDTPERTG